MIEIEKLKNAYDDAVDSALIENGDGMKAAIRIEKLFNKRCKEFKQKYKMNVGVYLTPQALRSQWAA